MDDDIVVRLRAAARSGDLTLGQSFDCSLVADEIEVLRVERDMLRDALQSRSALLSSIRALLIPKDK